MTFRSATRFLFKCFIVSGVLSIWLGGAAVAQTLSASLTANPDPVRPGERVFYTIRVSNTGAAALGLLTVTAPVPNHTRVVRDEIPDGAPALPSSVLREYP